LKVRAGSNRPRSGHGAPRLVKESPMLQHPKEQPQEPVGDATQRPAVRVSFGPKCRVFPLTYLVLLDADTTPVVDRVAEPFVARLSHHHVETLPASLRDRRDTGVRPEGCVVSFGDGLRGFCEHCGGDQLSHSRQGAKYSGVTGLALLRGLTSQ